LIDVTTTPVSHLGKSYVWRGSSEYGGSPGRAGQGPLGVVISEIVSNPGVGNPQGDAIELWNATGQPIDIGGWYLSDSAADLQKYAIPAGTILAAGQYIVFGENQFNPPGGGDRAFALNGTEGDDVWLSVATAGNVTAIADDVHFGPSVAGESFGVVAGIPRRLLPLSQPTLGQPNGDPRVGPIVVSEVQYHPTAPRPEALAIDPQLSTDDLEFLEVLNPTAQAVDVSQWKIEGGVEFEFDPGIVLAPGETILVLRFNPQREDNWLRTEAFRVQYGLTDDVRLTGGYAGQLSDSQDRVQLQRASLPGVPDPVYLFEDEVIYDDRAPWPDEADGSGKSLQRLSTASAGSIAENWIAADATPGQVRTIAADLNGDGFVDEHDIQRLCQAIADADPQYDLDGDGHTDFLDVKFYVWHVLDTHFGDANLDGDFDSNDFVEVFQAGEYEDAVPGNSTWSEGDWDCDGDFTTNDFVIAFQDGAYSAESVPRFGQPQPAVPLTIVASAISTTEVGGCARAPLADSSALRVPQQAATAQRQPKKEAADAFFPVLRRRSSERTAFPHESRRDLPAIDIALQELLSDSMMPLSLG
jgi:hypothetical protein